MEQRERDNEERKIELSKKRKCLQEIIKIKGNWIVTICGKKVEQLTDDDLDKIKESILKDEKGRLENRVRDNIFNRE